MHLPCPHHHHEVAKRAAAENLWLWPLSPCWSNGNSRQGLILGFGNIDEDKMLPAVRHLRRVLAL